MTLRILFVCTGNSCRSQMAEAFCRALGKDVECASAGAEPSAEIQPDTIAVMKETGIDISGARPRGFPDLPDLRFDWLVTMGHDVVGPLLPGAREVKWEVPNT
ncbi:arsenate reductase ArsC [candidate division WOR-3 bacterium]|nr:arsenate reductase ArsC [candidate division WOR-3 bacterium]